jgi:acyl-homoserine lactone acylase PvdQ
MSRIVAVAAAALMLSAAPAAAKDYAATARNILPGGQYGAVPPPPGADTQALMYDALTPLGGNVSDADIAADFKSEGFGVGPDGPARKESVPRKGVTILRDKYDVPHITGRTHDDVTWAMGWIAEEDRGLLLAQARYPGRLAAIDAPNVDAFGLVIGLKTYIPTRQVDRMIERTEVRALRGAGKDGRALLHDVDVYVAGLNARLKAEHSKAKRFTRVDVFAANALGGQIFGQGGGDEIGRAQFLAAETQRLGAAKAAQEFDDLSEFNDPDSPNTLSRPFPYEKIGNGKGNVALDAGSVQRTGLSGLASTAPKAHPNWASNFLIVGAKRSATGHPLFVAGPQIGYTYPQLTLEADVKGPGYQARGATAPGWPGTILIGRGPDFAWSLTSAGSDLIDTFAETLCGGSRTKYLYKGKCRKMGRVDAGVIQGSGRLVYNTTVHGPVVAYATSHGKPVALSRKRASYGKDILWQLPFRDMTLGRVRNTGTFFKSIARSPFTFNVGYADDKDIAMYSAGRLPIRDPRVDPRLPTNGNGSYEWRGFLKASKHPHAVNPPSGLLVNWNNRPAPDWGAADDNWAYGSAQRVQLLLAGLNKVQKETFASVVSAMNGAATTDFRNTVLTPTLASLLNRVPAPDARAARMLAILQAWLASGSSRIDANLDGVYDAGAAPAIMDALYPHLLEVALPVPGLTGIVGGDAGPASDFSSGGFWYLDKDLRRLVGGGEARPYKLQYCAGGDATACAQGIWAAFDAAASDLQATQGTADPDAWRANATKERISFRPGLLTTTLRFTNRPSGIQQVISFRGHRPRH